MNGTDPVAWFVAGGVCGAVVAFNVGRLMLRFEWIARDWFAVRRARRAAAVVRAEGGA